MKLTWVFACAVVVVLGCSKSEPTYKSNFASVRLDGEGIVVAKSGEAFSGTLVARDQEIAVVARSVLGPTYAHVAGTDMTGLVLVLPVENGVASGKASVRVDLHAAKLNPEVARRSDEALAVARARGATIVIAEATFVAGKLDGTATVFAPAGKAGAPVKVAEVQFANHAVHGTAVEYYPGTTQATRELRFEAGVQSGPQKWWHANGKLEREATFVANVPHGEMTEWYGSGAKRARGAYEGGKPVGTHEAWYPTGQREREAVFEHGELVREASWYSNGTPTDQPANGVVEEFHGNGNVHTRTSYEGGVKHGPFEAFYADGAKWKLGIFANGKLHGRYQEWWKNGKPALDCAYVAGELDGDYKRWYANGGQWEAARYVAGRRDGAYRKWWKNGKPAHAYTYKDGKLDGDYQQHYDNGAKWVVARYVMGKPQGAIQRWYPDGTLGYVMNHDERGRPHGPYKRWWADGKPRLDASYVAGSLDGDFKNWLEDGSVYEHATYWRGQKVKSSRWDATP